MRTLTLSTDFDTTNSFTVEVEDRRGVHSVRCTLERDMRKQGDGIYWGLNAGSVMRSHYTAEQVAELDRLRNMQPVRNGEVLRIAGESGLFVARVLGKFSDCVIFDRVTINHPAYYAPVSN